METRVGVQILTPENASEGHLLVGAEYVTTGDDTTPLCETRELALLLFEMLGLPEPANPDEPGNRSRPQSVEIDLDGEVQALAAGTARLLAKIGVITVEVGGSTLDRFSLGIDASDAVCILDIDGDKWAARASSNRDVFHRLNALLGSLLGVGG